MKTADIYPRLFELMVEEGIIRDNGDASGIFLKQVLIERANMIWQGGPSTGCESFSPGDRAYKNAGRFGNFEIVNL